MNNLNLEMSCEDFARLESLVSSLKQRNSVGQNYKYQNLSKLELEQKFMPIWLSWLRTGKLGGRPIGPRTIEIYNYYFKLFLRILPEEYTLPVISVDNFRLVLGEIQIERFSTRRNVYDSLMSATKFLIEHNEYTLEERSKLSKLKPRRFLPPKRPCINQEQLNEVITFIDLFKLGTSYSRLLNKTLVLFICNAGLRSFEVANLTLDDVDLTNCIINVRLGKGRKSRRVGVTQELRVILQEYLAVRLSKFHSRETFFVTGAGTPMSKHTIHQKLERLSKNFDFHFTPHALRRAFVTINVAKGRQLVYLQIACGHADITTTRSYCQTSEDEVLDAMRGW